MHLLQTPDETQRPLIRQSMDEISLIYEETLRRCPNLVELASNPQWHAIHLTFVDHIPPRPRGQVNSVEATAAMKISEATDINQAVSYLTKQEQTEVLATPNLFKALSNLPK